MKDKVPKIYVGSGKEKSFDWGTVVNITLDLDKLIHEFNAHGYVTGQGDRKIKVSLSGRREVGMYGDTHNVTLDTWHPDSWQRPEQIAVSDGSAKMAPKETPIADLKPEDEIPF
jgi:hypothetical protein